jgi:tetratricopeptide (TPR) repeat protein
MSGGRLDQVARRSFGSYRVGLVPLRAEGGALAAFHKTDSQIAPERFPPDRPLGEPAGVYVVGWRGGEIEVVGHLPPASMGDAPGRMFAADLDGDGADELVFDGHERGLQLVRVRRGQPAPRPLTIAGVRPIAVADLDGDGDAEIVAATQEEPARVLVLGSGDGRLAPLPSADIEPRALPPGLTDPVIAEAWARAEQLVAIGLPGRTARDLSAIARLAGHVAPDMLLRTAELFAAVGEDAKAAEHYEAAATRDDTTSAALGGAAAARRRLGEFAAAEALTRRRLAAVGPDERAAVAEELAALAAATETRPAVALTFAGPLDERWRISDPVAVRRDVVGRTLSLWASTAPVLAEYPLVWDGGPAALEVEVDIDEVEWGTGLGFQVIGDDDRPWLAVIVSGNGLSNAPVTEVEVEHDAKHNSNRVPVTGSRLRGRVAVYPAFDTAIRELDMGEKRRREVRPITEDAPYYPPPGPLRLQITSRMLMPDFISHVNVRAIRLTGFTAGEADAVGGAARLLAGAEYAAALAALTGELGVSRPLWRIEALLELGDVAAATAEARALIAATNADDPVYDALGQRLRRSDPLSVQVARAAYGAAWVDLLLPARLSLMLRPRDVPPVLLHLPAPDGPPPLADPVALRRRILVHGARGLALRHAGQLAAAQAAFVAGYALADGPHAAIPDLAALQRVLVRNLLEVAAELGDRDATLKWVRTTVEDNPSPYLALERLQSQANVVQVVPPETWAALMAEIWATRERQAP